MSTTSTGTNTGDNVWYTGDINWADFIIACAIKQLNIDTTHPRRGLQRRRAANRVPVVRARSGYLASVALVYSGGVGFPACDAGPVQCPTRRSLGARGATGDGGCTGLTAPNCDLLATSTIQFESAAKAAGAPMVIDCDEDQNHFYSQRLTNLAPVAWQFFKDHPFGKGKPDAYAGGLPTGFPSYCKIQ